MDTIEKIKHDGAIKALKQSIDSLQFELTNRNWSDLKDKNVYCRLGAAIADANRILKQMTERLLALREMEPENK